LVFEGIKNHEIDSDERAKGEERGPEPAVHRPDSTFPPNLRSSFSRSQLSG